MIVGILMFGCLGTMIIFGLALAFSMADRVAGPDPEWIEYPGSHQAEMEDILAGRGSERLAAAQDGPVTRYYEVRPQEIERRARPMSDAEREVVTRAHKQMAAEWRKRHEA